MNQENFGHKIKLLRNQNKMTQDDLASKLNVTRQAVSNWERGITIPDINMIEKISNIFSTSIDGIISGEIQKIEKQYDRRGTIFLYIFSIALVVLNIIVSGYIYKEIKLFTIFPVSTILFIETIVFFTFNNAIKNNDFSIIAGYDSKAKYNTIALKKVLYSIENHTLISSTIFICIFTILGHINTLKSIEGILIILYVLEFIISIILINIKNIDYLFKNSEDIRKSKIGNYISIVFITFIFLAVGVLTYSMEIYDIENNSIEAVKLIGIMAPYIILSLIAFFNEQIRLKEYIKRQKSYLPSKLTYIFMFICIVLLIVMIIVARRV
jgi:transcriptional regulator with XRE-family HTH domain